MDLKVEYLIVLKQKGSFCNNVRTFNNLIGANDELIIKGEKLLYKQLEVRYNVTTDDILNKEQRFFNVTIVSSNIDKIDEFESLLKTFREIIYKTEGSINTIWDDVSAFYGKNAYPLIYELENLLRKLITKFMVINVGMEWMNETLPSELKDAVKKKKKESTGYSNFLHETDFIHLTDYLFKQYQTNDLQNLFNDIRNANEGVSLERLKQYVPISNWEKYFAKIVECEDLYLKKRWARLYELRCLVAHNNFVKKNDYDEILELCKELKKIIEKAINNTNKVNVSQQDKEIIVETVISNLNELNSVFNDNWKLFVHKMYAYASKFDLTNHEFELPISILSISKILKEQNAFPSEIEKEIFSLIIFRNALFHLPNKEINEKDVANKINILKEVINFLDQAILYKNVKGSTQNLFTRSA